MGKLYLVRCTIVLWIVQGVSWCEGVSVYDELYIGFG